MYICKYTRQVTPSALPLDLFVKIQKLSSVYLRESTVTINLWKENF